MLRSLIKLTPQIAASTQSTTFFVKIVSLQLRANRESTTHVLVSLEARAVMN